MLYNLLKFLHVLSVIVWLGGLISLAIIMGRVSRLADQASSRLFMQQGAFFGQRILGPAAGLTLITGLALAGVTRSFPFWMIWGLAAMIATMAVGGLVQGRAAAEMMKLSQGPNPDESRLAELRKRLATGGLVMIAILLTAVWAMVYKPVL